MKNLSRAQFQTRTDMRKHFHKRHPNDILRVEEEGPDPYPKCALCLKHVNPRYWGRHNQSKECEKGQKSKERREANQHMHDMKTFRFSIGTEELENVDQFSYLGRPILANDDDIGAIRHNITKARKKWQTLSQILTRQGARPKIMGVFYKAVIQAILLYGSETWVMTKEKYNLLNSFHIIAA
jgi:hypothetical protein